MQYGKSAVLCNVLLGNLGFGYFDIYTTDPNIADHVHPFMAAIFPDASGLFQQDDVPCYTVKECFEEHDRVLNGDLASKFQRSRSDQTSI